MDKRNSMRTRNPDNNINNNNSSFLNLLFYREMIFILFFFLRFNIVYSFFIYSHMQVWTENEILVLLDFSNSFYLKIWRGKNPHHFFK